MIWIKSWKGGDINFADTRMIVRHEGAERSCKLTPETAAMLHRR
jgi:hypothetical protein